MSIDTNKGNKIDCSPLHVKSEAYFKGVGDNKLSKDNMYRLVNRYIMIQFYSYVARFRLSKNKLIATE